MSALPSSGRELGRKSLDQPRNVLSDAPESKGKKYLQRDGNCLVKKINKFKKLGSAYGMWTFPGQGSNPSHSSDNINVSLTIRAPENLPPVFFNGQPVLHLMVKLE